VKVSFAELAKRSSVIADNSSLLAIASLRKDYLTLHQQYVNETDAETKSILKEMTQDAKAIYEKAKSKGI
jgi:hypothetical protein